MFSVGQLVLREGGLLPHTVTSPACWYVTQGFALALALTGQHKFQPIIYPHYRSWVFTNTAFQSVPQDILRNTGKIHSAVWKEGIYVALVLKLTHMTTKGFLRELHMLVMQPVQKKYTDTFLNTFSISCITRNSRLTRSCYWQGIWKTVLLSLMVPQLTLKNWEIFTCNLQ